MIQSFFMRRLSLDCVGAQADLSLRWERMSDGTFSDISAHILKVIKFERNATFNKNIIKGLRQVFPLNAFSARLNTEDVFL